MGASAPPFLKLEIFKSLLECFTIQDLPVNLSLLEVLMPEVPFLAFCMSCCKCINLVN